MNAFNIVYIHSHDTGRYVQPYGHDIPTPNIQKLAEQGVLFRQAYCANPTCSPSRGALLTGQWPHSCGMFGLVNRGWSIEHPEHLLMHTLQSNGYETVLAGFQHVVRDVADAGWSRVLSTESDQSKPLAHEMAVSYLAQDHDRPFFLDVGFGETHRMGDGFSPPPPGEEPTDARYVRVPAPFPDTPELREDMALFHDAARTLDQRMGAVFDALDKHGLRENTLVVCTTDHGIAFPTMKCHLTDHGMGVMLVMRGPGGLDGGKVIDGMVSHVDLFPTICEVLEIAPPHWLQGVSMMPLVRGDVSAVRDETFAEVNYHAAYEPQRAIRTQRWKYIRRYSDRDRPVLTNCDDCLTKSYLVDQGWRDVEISEERLYDTVFDPGETCNLSHSSEHSSILADLRQRLDTWMQQTADPLLKADIVEPAESGSLNAPGDYSPSRDPHYPAREILGL
ncbi:MAG: sulfatase [Candidatus Latescibacteria bacterium]|nr:sulfatase [Candidatus Latescibacterota bacterium]